MLVNNYLNRNYAKIAHLSFYIFTYFSNIIFEDNNLFSL